MPTPPSPSLLVLARRWGVLPEWVDARGPQRASAEAITAALRALGAPVDRPGDAEQALGAEVPDHACAIAWDGHTDLPGPFVLEDGTEHSGGGPLPFGVHTWQGPHGPHDVISAPTRAPGGPERSWGAFLPLYALQTPDTWGLGDLTALGDLGEWLGSLGARVVGTLPLLATEAGEPSPYSPVSRLFFNERYLDVHAIPEVGPLPEGVRDRIAALRQGEHVDHDGVERLKREVLLPAVPELFSRRYAQLQAWLHEDDHREHYAVFRGEREYHVAVQFWLHEQLTALRQRLDAAGVDLYLDLPLGANAGGYDAWAFRSDFVEGISVGAPPDPLFTGGQDWGFRPLHPDRSRRGGHGYLRACLRAQLRYARRLRIDHVLGVVRQYWVPQGHPASDGVYVRYPAEEWLAAMCLEAHRAGARLVGEDLGVVSPEIREALPRHGIAGMYLGQVSPPGQPPPPGCVASWDTHDTATLAGWRHGDDLVDQVDLGLLQAADLPARRAGRARYVAEWDAAIDDPWRWLARSEASLVLVTLEDLWGERRPQNVPGTWRERPNWLRRAQRDLDGIRQLAPVLAAIDQAR